MATREALCADLVLRQAQDEVPEGIESEVALMVSLSNHEGVALEMAYGNA